MHRLVWTAGLVSMSVSLGCSGGTGNSSTSQTTRLATEVVNSVELLPVNQFVYDALGGDPTAIADALFRARYTSTGECLEGKGFINLEVPPPPDISDQSAMFAATIYVGEIESGAVNLGYDEATSSSPEYKAAAAECSAAAAVQFPNPLEGFTTWMSANSRSLNAATLSDPSYLAARASYQACLEQLGFTEEAADELKGSYVDKANAELSKYISGEVSKEAALQKLRKLSAEEQSALSDIKRCTDALSQGYYSARYELEVAFLEVNGPAIREELDKGRAFVERLEAYLAPQT